MHLKSWHLIPQRRNPMKARTTYTIRHYPIRPEDWKPTRTIKEFKHILYWCKEPQNFTCFIYSTQVKPKSGSQLLNTRIASIICSTHRFPAAVTILNHTTGYCIQSHNQRLTGTLCVLCSTKPLVSCCEAHLQPLQSTEFRHVVICV